jgi:hypothetical protein
VNERANGWTSGGGQFLSYVRALQCHAFFVVVLSFLHHALCLSNVPNMEKSFYVERVRVLIGCSVPSVHDAPHYISVVALFSPALFYIQYALPVVSIRWKMMPMSDHVKSWRVGYPSTLPLLSFSFSAVPFVFSLYLCVRLMAWSVCCF